MVRTVEKIFSNVCRAVKIPKLVSIHSLRHSYATHLLESGIGLLYAQEILGHRSSNITEICTDVSNKYIGKVKSPLDNLNMNQKRGWNNSSVKDGISELGSYILPNWKDIRS